jgi:nitroreductase
MAETTLSTNKKETSGQVSRREFLKNAGLIACGAAIGSMAILSTQTKTTTVTTPLDTATTTVTATSRPATKGATLSEALRNRKSASAFQPQALSKEKLLDLLWAAWGINRPDSGKRTAPTAMNTQEIDIYVLLPDGVYVYDAKGNQLTPVLAQDLRTKTGSTGVVKDAPVHLLFVADYAKYRAIPQSQKELYSAAHTGFIGQNVYLYCASEGLGARFYAGIDRATLKDSLKLRNDQAIVFAQAVGYPKE